MGYSVSGTPHKRNGLEKPRKLEASFLLNKKEAQPTAGTLGTEINSQG